MSYMLSSRPVKAGGHKYTCGSLSGGHWCWNSVFGARSSATIGTANREGSLPTTDPIAATAALGVKWMHMTSTAFVDVAGLNVVVGMSGWNFG